MHDAANYAALPAFVDVAVKYEAAMVFTIVTSHTKQRPSRLGSGVRPSSRLPSVRKRPLNIFVGGIIGHVKERKMMLFKLLCRIILPLQRLHDSACDPFTSTAAPQKHV